MSNDRRFEDQLNSYLDVVCRREKEFGRKKSQLSRKIVDASTRHADENAEQLMEQLSESELVHKKSLDTIVDLIDALHPHAHPADKKRPEP
ncbi:hypothetical protein [Hyphomicrobium sp. CS1GBMeth3]|uniref:hypothetical protein n=1 Tax=Hyphomicrobium sp. CS1GBMeth3 TaxID=1892845 RepID=UPI0009317B20|nr:hypothetical protein [Hyphomicrobium sp. CS1GBMeth3]